MNPVEYLKEKGFFIVNIITEDLQDNIHPYNNVSIEGCGPYLSDIHGINILEESDDRVVFEGEYEIMADMGPSRPLTKEDPYVKITFEKVE